MLFTSWEVRTEKNFHWGFLLTYPEANWNKLEGDLGKSFTITFGKQEIREKIQSLWKMYLCFSVLSACFWRSRSAILHWANSALKIINHKYSMCDFYSFINPSLAQKPCQQIALHVDSSDCQVVAVLAISSGGGGGGGGGVQALLLLTKSCGLTWLRCAQCCVIKIVKKLKQNECAGSICMHPYPRLLCLCW
jgi:hypothetical protein